MWGFFFFFQQIRTVGVILKQQKRMFLLGRILSGQESQFGMELMTNSVYLDKLKSLTFAVFYINTVF